MTAREQFLAEAAKGMYEQYGGAVLAAAASEDQGETVYDEEDA